MVAMEGMIAQSRRRRNESSPKAVTVTSWGRVDCESSEYKRESLSKAVSKNKLTQLDLPKAVNVKGNNRPKQGT